jgi:hypothetical protein
MIVFHRPMTTETGSQDLSEILLLDVSVPCTQQTWLITCVGGGHSKCANPPTGTRKSHRQVILDDQVDNDAADQVRVHKLKTHSYIDVWS